MGLRTQVGGDSEVGSHPLLCNQLETDSLGHMRLYLKKIK